MSNMKVGILTLPIGTNYGGILQAYALEKILERMGHEVVVINKDRVCLKWYQAILKVPYRFLRKYVLGDKNKTVFFERKKNEENAIVTQYTSQFMKKNMNVISVCEFSKIKQLGLDAIVVGSDQIWRRKYLHANFINVYDAFLQFASEWNVKRIAYAASFGTDEWEYTEKETSVIRRLLGRFDAVSVREYSGLSLCKEHLSFDSSELMIDPTLLLNAEDYLEGMENVNDSGEIISYILDEGKVADEVIERVSSYLFAPCVSIAPKHGKDLPAEERILAPLEEWICRMRSSKFVITDSFHACVFCIIFRKPFVVIRNKDRGVSRLDTLLNNFNLANRAINNAGDINMDLFSIPLDNLIIERELEVGYNLAFDFFTQKLKNA